MMAKLLQAAVLAACVVAASASEVMYRAAPSAGSHVTQYEASYDFAKRHGGLQNTVYSNCFACGSTPSGKVKVSFTSLEFEYTGSLLGTGQNAQGSKSSVTGTFTPQVAVVSVSSSGSLGTYTVAAGSKFTVPGGFSAYTQLSIQGALAVEIHTSCSVPLAVGDQFGPFILTNFNTAGGGSGMGCMSTAPAPGFVAGCTICDHNNKDRPPSLTFSYGSGQGKNQNAQGAKAYGSGLLASYPASTTVTVSGKKGGSTTQSVSAGGRITIQAPGGKFDAESTVTFGNGQSFNFHTSCSVPLRTGDVFGPLTILGGGRCPVNPATTQPVVIVTSTSTSTTTTTWTPPPPPPRGPYCYTNPEADCTINTCGVRSQTGFQFPTPMPKTNCPVCPPKTTTSTTTTTTTITVTTTTTTTTTCVPVPQVVPAQIVDICTLGGRPSQIMFEYTGGASMTQNQDSKATVTGGAVTGAATIQASSTKEQGNTQTSGTLNAGDTFVLTASAMGLSKMPTFTRLLIVSTTDATRQEVIIHTSCSKPINTDDDFGAVRVLGTASDLTQPSTVLVGCNLPVSPTTQDICSSGSGKGHAKPSTIHFRYVGGDSGTTNMQNGKASVSGTSSGLASIQTYGSGGLAVNAQPGDDFTLGSGGKIDAQTVFTITSSGGTQSVSIHTSCSYPLYIGDRFGGLVVIGFNDYIMQSSSRSASSWTATDAHQIGTLSFYIQGGAPIVSKAALGNATGDALSDCVENYQVNCYNSAESGTVVYQGGVSGTKVFETSYLQGDSSRITCDITAPCLTNGTNTCTQEIIIDLSCAFSVEDDLHVDDSFGALRLWGYTRRGNGARQECRRPPVPVVESITCEKCCTMPPTFCDDSEAKDEYVPKVGKCVNGSLPAATRAELTNFVREHAGAVCESNNREPSGAKGSVVWYPESDDSAAVEAQVASVEASLCAAEESGGEICPDTELTFTCCDPCADPHDVNACITTSASFNIGFQSADECPLPNPRPCLPYPDIPAFAASPFSSENQLIPFKICSEASSTITSIQFQYTSGSAAASVHKQDGMAVVMGTSKGTASAITIASAEGGNIGQTFADVRVGNYFTVSGSFGSDILLDIQSIGVFGNTPRMQRINIHTSCSKPLAVGDTFGGVIITGFNGFAVETAASAITTGAHGYSMPVSAYSVNVLEDICYMESCPFGYDYTGPIPVAPSCTLCCSMPPYFTKPFDEDFPKVDDKCVDPVNGDFLPPATMSALETWFDNKGGASCSLRNMKFDDPVWHAFVHTGDNKTEVFNATDVAAYFCEVDAGTCPTMKLTFKCCDPCAKGEPDMFCEEGTAEIKIVDQEPPVIETQQTQRMECTKGTDPNDNIKTWEAAATCTDGQQPLTGEVGLTNTSAKMSFSSSTGGGYPFAYPITQRSECVQLEKVDLVCVDDCANDAATQTEFIFEDTQKPFFVERPKDFYHQCDGSLGLQFHSSSYNRDPLDVNILATDASSAWSPYFDYSGQRYVHGDYMVMDNHDGSLSIIYDLHLNETDSVGGIHIHEGTNCSIDAKRHHYSGDLAEDPWTTQWSTDSVGHAHGTHSINSGFNYNDNNGRTVIVHDSAGTRIACAVLEPSTVKMTIASALNLWINRKLTGYEGSADDKCASPDQLTWTPNTYNPTFNKEYGARCTQKAKVKWTVADQCGHTIETDASFSLVDDTPPTLSGGSDLTIDCEDGNINRQLTAWLDSHAGLSADDECSDEITWSYSPNPVKLSKTCPQSTKVQFTATDVCGNDAVSQEFTFSVVDKAPPFITKPAADLEVECSPAKNTQQLTAWLRDYAAMEADDICFPSPPKCPVFEEPSVGSCPYCGNMYAPVCSQSTEYVNMCHAHCHGKKYTEYTLGPCTTTMAPDAHTTMPAECDSCKNNYKPVCVRGNTEFDNSCLAYCHGEFEFVNTACNPAPPPYADCSYCEYSIGGVVCGTDGASYPTPCHAACNDVFSYYEGMCRHTEEACGANVLDWDVSASNNLGRIGSECVTTITADVVAKDGCNNQVTDQAEFIVSDKSAPVIEPKASHRTVECNFIANAVDKRTYQETNGGALAKDACTNGVQWDQVGVPSGDVCPHTIAYTFTVEDQCGNTDLSRGKLTVEDTTPPYFIIQAQDATMQCSPDGNYAEIEAYLNSRASATADDECRWESDNGTIADPSLMWHIPDVPELVPSCLQKQVFVFGVTDECGNLAQSQSTVTIEDRAAPTITKQPVNGKVPCGPDATKALRTWLDTQAGAMAVDECGNGAKWSHTFPGMADGACGQKVVLTFTAKDKCGNSIVSDPATFEIYDDVAPEITAMDKVVECSAVGHEKKLDTWLKKNGDGKCTDTCDSEPVINDNNPTIGFIHPDALNGDFVCQDKILNATFTCTDDCMNQATADASFYVVDSEPPQIYGYGTDLLHYCDERCTDSVSKENSDAKRLFDTWVESERGCFTAEDCNEMRWTISVVASSATTFDIDDLCGTSGQVAFTVTDACGHSSSRTLGYDFPVVSKLPPPPPPLIPVPPTQGPTQPPGTVVTAPVITFTLPTVTMTTTQTTHTTRTTTRTTVTPPPPPPPPATVTQCSPVVVDVCGTQSDYSKGMGKGTRPNTVMFEYVGGNTLSNQQEGKASVTGAGFTSTAESISGGGVTKTNVKIGDLFSLGTDGAESTYTITRSGTTQSIEIHTSCSKSLMTGDVFGGLKVVGYNGQQQSVSCVNVAVTTVATEAPKTDKVVIPSTTAPNTTVATTQKPVFVTLAATTSYDPPGCCYSYFAAAGGNTYFYFNYQDSTQASCLVTTNGVSFAGRNFAPATTCGLLQSDHVSNPPATVPAPMQGPHDPGCCYTFILKRKSASTSISYPTYHLVHHRGDCPEDGDTSAVDDKGTTIVGQRFEPGSVCTDLITSHKYQEKQRDMDVFAYKPPQDCAASVADINVCVPGTPPPTTITTTVTTVTTTRTPPPPTPRPVVTNVPPKDTIPVPTTVTTDPCGKHGCCKNKPGLPCMDSACSNCPCVPQYTRVDVCPNGRPSSIEFQYVGGTGMTNTQSNKASSSGTSFGTAEFISGAGYQASQVLVGDIFSIGGKIEAYSSFTIISQGGRQQVEVHTSCSKALYVGDRFGGLVVSGFNGRTFGNNCPGQSAPPSCTPISTDVCGSDASSSGKGGMGTRPSSIIFKYVGGSGLATSGQGGKATASGSSSGSANSISGGGVAQNNVNIGDSVTLGVSGAWTSYTVVSQGGYQMLEIHTSCSVPLMIGDRFGGLQVIGFNGQVLDTCSLDTAAPTRAPTRAPTQAPVVTAIPTTKMTPQDSTSTPGCCYAVRNVMKVQGAQTFLVPMYTAYEDRTDKACPIGQSPTDGAVTYAFAGGLTCTRLVQEHDAAVDGCCYQSRYSYASTITINSGYTPSNVNKCFRGGTTNVYVEATACAAVEAQHAATQNVVGAQANGCCWRSVLSGSDFTYSEHYRTNAGGCDVTGAYGADMWAFAPQKSCGVVKFEQGLFDLTTGAPAQAITAASSSAAAPTTAAAATTAAAPVPSGCEVDVCACMKGTALQTLMVEVDAATAPLFVNGQSGWKGKKFNVYPNEEETQTYLKITGRGVLYKSTAHKGEVLTLNADDTRNNKFPTAVMIIAGKKAPKTRIKFGTNCKNGRPLKLGDVFGIARVVGYTMTNGKTCSIKANPATTQKPYYKAGARVADVGLPNSDSDDDALSATSITAVGVGVLVIAMAVVVAGIVTFRKMQLHDQDVVMSNAGSEHGEPMDQPEIVVPANAEEHLTWDGQLESSSVDHTAAPIAQALAEAAIPYQAN